MEALDINSSRMKIPCISNYFETNAARLSSRIKIPCVPTSSAATAARRHVCNLLPLHKYAIYTEFLSNHCSQTPLQSDAAYSIFKSQKNTVYSDSFSASVVKRHAFTLLSLHKNAVYRLTSYQQLQPDAAYSIFESQNNAVYSDFFSKVQREMRIQSSSVTQECRALQAPIARFIQCLHTHRVSTSRIVHMTFELLPKSIYLQDRPSKTVQRV